MEVHLHILAEKKRHILTTIARKSTYICCAYNSLYLSCRFANVSFVSSSSRMASFFLSMWMKAAFLHLRISYVILNVIVYPVYSLSVFTSSPVPLSMQVHISPCIDHERCPGENTYQRRVFSIHYRLHLLQ